LRVAGWVVVALTCKVVRARHRLSRFFSLCYLITCRPFTGAWIETVTLFALHDGQLIGAFRDTDVGGLDLRHWNSDGTMFGAGDPDPLDLVLADDTIETPPAKRHREPTDSVVVPILGRIS
jgi:hypothetical protein